MAAKFTPIVPARMKPLYDEYKFAPATLAGNCLQISGVLGIDDDLSVPEEFEVQLENVFSALGDILNEAGAGFENVTALQSYHVGCLGEQISQFQNIRSKYMSEPHCSWTSIEVAGLALPGAVIEVSAVAYVG